jgi:hypothetical protein
MDLRFSWNFNAKRRSIYVVVLPSPLGAHNQRARELTGPRAPGYPLRLAGESSSILLAHGSITVGFDVGKSI